MFQPLPIIAGLSVLLLFLFLIAAVVTVVRKRNYFRGAVYLAMSICMGSLILLTVVTALSIQGYHALTHEVVAAEVDVRPLGEQRFSARLRFPDGTIELFHLAGDELYIDARILKWKPVFNILGLHTAYELDRIGGRYTTIEDEKIKERTLYRLSPSRPVDIFNFGRRYVFLQPILDAEYGSATFAPVMREGSFELRVSTTGLLIRGVRLKPEG